MNSLPADPLTNRLETSQHLFRAPRYQASNGTWHDTFRDALRNSCRTLTWNPAAIQSIVTHGFACGDMTLVNEIRRQPWLSEIGPNQQPILQPIPPHHQRWQSPDRLAERFLGGLHHEVDRALYGRSEVYVPLSGGADSRLIAAATAHVARQEQHGCRLLGVTWGLPDCADVAYGKAVAKTLGLDWIHVPLDAADLRRNIDLAAFELGALISPVNLHALHWFAQLPSDALVLAGSYGNSIGRGTFGKVHLLEERPLSLPNLFNLMTPETLSESRRRFQSEVAKIHARANSELPYVRREHERHVNATRGLLAHAMSIINRGGTVYQLLTDPTVYRFVWSLHPALRRDQIYRRLLLDTNHPLRRIPLTDKSLEPSANRALFCGHTSNGLRKNFHDYRRWTRQLLQESLSDLLEPDWFEATGLFQGAAINRMRRHIEAGAEEFWPYNVLCWLATLRRFADWANEMGIRITADPNGFTAPSSDQTGPTTAVGFAPIRALRNSQSLRAVGRKVRRVYYVLDSRRRYPVTP